MGRLKLIMALVGHYKYAIVIIAGIILVGFVDENSFMHRVQLEMQISDLRQQIDKYNTQNEDDMRKLKELNHDPGAYQRIARERYLMQTDDEDIYVLLQANPSHRRPSHRTPSRRPEAPPHPRGY